MIREDKDSSSGSAADDCIQALLWTDRENQADEHCKSCSTAAVKFLFSILHYATQMGKTVELRLFAFLASVLGAGERLVSRFFFFPSGNESPCEGVWVLEDVMLVPENVVWGPGLVWVL